MTDTPPTSDAPPAAPVKGKNPTEDGFSARMVAAYALAEVYGKGKALDTALVTQSGFNDLSSRDRAFARLLAATTLRRSGQIDKILKYFLKKRPFEPTHSVIRMGAAQILFLGTPPHAAVDSSVNVLKANPKTKAMSGLANAVLRNVVRDGGKHLANTRPLDNIPKWLRESWDASYGKPAVRRMANVLVSEPPLDLQVKSQDEAGQWAEVLGADILQDGTLRLQKTGKVTDLPGFDDGAWWVQDTSASLPVKRLGDLKGKRVLDMCAAPGGKTMQLAAAGADVVALDKNADRLALIGENLKRTGLSAELIATDAGEWKDQSTEGFDIVLLDAPCSSTGTFRRHPDVLYNKAPKDMRSLVGLQKRLLKTAATHLKPNGTLIYCTCSLEAREGEDQVASFLKTQPQFCLISDLRYNAMIVEGALSQTESLAGTIRIRPDMNAEIGGMDGFFIAVFRCH